MIDDLVKNTVKEMNEKAVVNVEKTVKGLVSAIIEAESEIVTLQATIKENKEKLKALQMPAEIKLDL